MTEFVMPSLGADMEDGTLVEQLIRPGDPVHRGDIIAAVETQKGAIEIEVFEDGFLDKWLIPLGTKVAVGTPIAVIRASDTPDLPQPADRQHVTSHGCHLSLECETWLPLQKMCFDSDL